jgi:hypothetical protein
MNRRSSEPSRRDSGRRRDVWFGLHPTLIARADDVIE